MWTTRTSVGSGAALWKGTHGGGLFTRKPFKPEMLEAARLLCVELSLACYFLGHRDEGWRPGARF